MNRSLIRKGIQRTIISLSLVCAALPAARAQQQGSSQPPPKSGAAGQGQAQPEAPKMNPQEQADYKAFVDAPDPDKKIQLGQGFLQKYPMSIYVPNVNSQLVPAYFSKEDWNNFYATADRALAKNPDDVDVLTLVGWVIPHAYNSSDPDAEKKLDKAETYEKHALDLIPTIPKPPALSDDLFASAKAQKLSQAHSGLGLVYFRRGDAEDAAKELQQATQAAGSADPTDFYVLGVELQQLKRNSEAADAFQKCSQIPSNLQDRCKQSAAQAKAAK
jgi:tetratricopeptide (TPR) repeat protein